MQNGDSEVGVHQTYDQYSQSGRLKLKRDYVIGDLAAIYCGTQIREKRSSEIAPQEHRTQSHEG